MTTAVLKFEANADSLISEGILDIVQAPVEGRHLPTDIPWRDVSHLALDSMIIAKSDDPRFTEYHQLTVHFKDSKPFKHSAQKPLGISLRHVGQGGVFAINTATEKKSEPSYLHPLTGGVSNMINAIIEESMQHEPYDMALSNWQT